MKSRAVFLILANAIGLLVGFWLYGAGRTMCETVKFTAKASLFGIITGVLIPLTLITTIYLANRVFLQHRKALLMTPFLVAFAISLIIGSFASEAWILFDENRFFAETSGARTLYSRPRAWPNHGCTLVFVPGEGVRSTD